MKNKFRVLTASYQGKTFRIEEDVPEVGWYVYQYDNKGNCTADSLQENLEMAFKCASDLFGVPQELWEEKSK